MRWRNGGVSNHHQYRHGGISAAYGMKSTYRGNIKA